MENKMTREEMINMLMQNAISKTLGFCSTEEAKTRLEREFFLLTARTDMELQNMVVINCF